MLARQRVKRANPEQLYKTCKATGGDCPPDVIKRYEQTTPADSILKYGSVGVFFGGLGIGTGRGGGGTVLGAGAVGGRPSISSGAIGPRDILPIESGGPSLAEEIPLLPMAPRVPRPTDPFRPSVLEEPFIIRPPERPNILHEQRFPTDAAPFDNGNTEITTIPSQYDVSGGGVDIQIIELPSVNDPGPSVVTRTQYNNPTFEVEVSTDISGETSSTDNIIVGAESGGTSVGDNAELIPLLDISRGDTIDTTILAPGEEETAFVTSTPERVPIQERLPIRPYGRQYQQVRVTDPEFLDRPAVLVSLENPVFDADITLTFEDDLQALRSDTDLRDVRRLSRPYYQRRTTGLRVSRLGQRRGTISTRSGVQVGSAAHFFQDISPIGQAIEPIDAIELDVLGEQSGEGTIVRGDPTPSIEQDIGLTALGDNIENELQEIDLLTADGEEDQEGRDLQLVFSTGNDEVVDIMTIPIRAGGDDRPSVFIFSDDGTHIVYPTSTTATTPLVPAQPSDVPYIVVDLYSGSMDYDIHPSLLRRKRKKRKRVYFSDGRVASRPK